jgi:hypothetical protein
MEDFNKKKLIWLPKDLAKEDLEDSLKQIVT